MRFSFLVAPSAGFSLLRSICDAFSMRGVTAAACDSLSLLLHGHQVMHFLHHAAHLGGGVKLGALADAAQPQGLQGILLPLGAFDPALGLDNDQFAHRSRASWLRPGGWSYPLNTRS